jgi:multidrug efflux pump subunit AcrB
MIEYLIRKRKITLLFFFMIIATGFLSFFQLPHQQDPDVIVNQAIVETIYPGASAEKVEQTVTKEIEQRIKELQGIENIISSSGNGYSHIVVEAKEGEDFKKLWDELRKKVKDAEADLPDDAEQPVINDDLERQAFYTFNLTAESREQLYSLRETVNNWRDQLRTVPGVADISIGGLPEQEVRVDVDTKKLQQYGITWTQVMAAVKAENEKIPIGDLSIKDRIYQLKLPDTYKLEELNRVIITRSTDGFPVYLQDIGRAYLTTERVKTYIYHNGKPAIIMGIIVEKGTDIPSLQLRVDKMMQTLQKSLPVWSKVEPVFSANKEINTLFSNLKREILIAVAAVIFVCTLGLNFITALMVAIAIPISMAAGLVFLPFLNITLNNITIYSMIMVLGILVDDAVVVNDNIERRLFILKESPYNACVNGAREVSISILTATMATLFSFGPLLFLSGDVGQFIKPIPTVIILTMLASMAMSLTVIPIFRQWYERRHRQNEAEERKPAGLLGRQLNLLTHWYANKLMPRMLKHPLRTGLFGVLIGTLAYGLVPFTPVELFPAADREELPLLISLPQGSDVEETNRFTREVQDWVSRQPHVKEVTSVAGARANLWFGAGMDLEDVADENAMVMAKLDTNKVKLQETADRWSEELKQKYPAADINPFIIKDGPPVGDPITIHIYGDDIGKLRQISQQVRDMVSKVPGTRKIQDNFGLDRYALEFQVNKAMMEQRLVNYNDLSSTLRLVSEGIDVSEFDNGKDLIDIKLYAEKPGEDPLAVFQHMTVANARGEQIPLAEIATIKPSFAIQTIPHRNLSRVVTITGDVHNRTATEVMNDITQFLKEMNLPEGYRWEAGGETSEQEDIFIDIGKLSIVVFFLILIQIAMQFNSISLPFLVMSTVYLAIAGSMIGLFITRTPLGFMSMLGCMSLAGIVVRNGIVLIDFIEEASKAGTELEQAVIQAGEARLRPILLTSMTAIAGLMPLALSGDPLFTPLATAIISGLLLSTMLTLIVVPSLYTVLARYKEKRLAKREDV